MDAKARQNHGSERRLEEAVQLWMMYQDVTRATVVRKGENLQTLGLWPPGDNRGLVGCDQRPGHAKSLTLNRAVASIMTANGAQDPTVSLSAYSRNPSIQDEPASNLTPLSIIV
jgi:hypothetical protein